MKRTFSTDPFVGVINQFANAGVNWKLVCFLLRHKITLRSDNVGLLESFLLKLVLKAG